MASALAGPVALAAAAHGCAATGGTKRAARAYCRPDPAEARAHIADRAGVTTPLTESPAGRVQHVCFGCSGSAVGIGAVTTDALNGPKALCWRTSGFAIGGLRFGLPAALVFSLSSSALRAFASPCCLIGSGLRHERARLGSRRGGVWAHALARMPRCSSVRRLCAASTSASESAVPIARRAPSTYAKPGSSESVGPGSDSESVEPGSSESAEPGSESEPVEPRSSALVEPSESESEPVEPRSLQERSSALGLEP